MLSQGHAIDSNYLFFSCTVISNYFTEEFSGPKEMLCSQDAKLVLTFSVLNILLFDGHAALA